MVKIGVGITTHNRRQVAYHAVHRCKAITKQAKIVVVDDASNPPFPHSTFRFEQNVGIPKAKNKCIELLDECDYVFLLDDDCFPIATDWCDKYIEASIKTGNQHFSFTYDHNKNGKFSGNAKVRSYMKNGILLHQYANPNGCMLFFTKECISKAGGMDIEFNRYGFEHMEHSRRIHNMGLTDAPFLDIDNSDSLFVSRDQYGYRCSSVSIASEIVENNRSLYEQKCKDNFFKPYK